MEIVRLFTSNDELEFLIGQFRRHLSKLNRSVQDVHKKDIVSETQGYFRENNVVFGGLYKDRLVAFTVLSEREGCFWMEWIYVDEQYRRKGFAKALFEAAEEFARVRGESQLYIWVHPDNDLMISFLKQCGYDTLNLLEITKKDKPEVKEVKILGHTYKY